MNSSSECQWTDAVIANALDGAAGHGEGQPDASACVAHLSECPTCETDLARARRTDALVATCADSRVCDEVAARWLDCVAGVESSWTVDVDRDSPAPGAGAGDLPAPGAGAGGANLSGWARYSLVGLVVAICVGLSWWQRRPDSSLNTVPSNTVSSNASSAEVSPQSSPPVAEPPDSVSPPPSTTPRSPTLAEIGDVASSPVESRRISDGLAAAHSIPIRSSRGLGELSIRIGRRIDIEDPAAWWILWVEARARSSRFGWWRSKAQLQRATDTAWHALRLRRVTELAELAVRSDAAFDDLVSRLARWDGDQRGQALAIVRSEIPERRWLRRLRRIRVGRPAGVDRLAVAVQIGVGERVDALARRRALVVAADGPRFARSLSGVSTRPGRARLLLGLWGDQCARYQGVDDLDGARRWFLRQPAEVEWQLLGVLDRSRDGGERRRALLGLAAMRADSEDVVAAVCHLIETCASEDEARLAAFVLSRVDVAIGGLSRRLPRREYLRVAALLARLDPRVGGVLDELRMTGDLRVIFETGDLNEAQFRALATRCRSRAATDRHLGRARGRNSSL